MVLAGELGVSLVTVSKWCSQKTQPDLKTLSRIAELLQLIARSLNRRLIMTYMSE